MPTSEQAYGRSWRVAPVAAAALALLGLAAAAGGGAPLAEAGEEQDLSLLRQFHSYAPARHAARPAAADKAQARAALMRKARAAWKRGAYTQARKFFMQAFKAGEVTAGWYLGYLYRTGRGGKVDHAKAFGFYRALARRYDADERNMRRLMLTVDALVRVADYYRTGIGKQRRKQDLRRAFRLYSMAAAHNHPGAFYGMAMVALASNGRVARQRWVVGWLKRAASAGHANAAARLAALAEKGMHGLVRPDPVAARAWRIIAMRLRGPAVVKMPLPDAAPAQVAASLSPEQEAQAQRLANRFLATALRGMALRNTIVPPQPPTANVSTVQ